MSNPTCRVSHSSSARASNAYIEAYKQPKKRELLGYGETFLTDTAKEYHPDWSNARDLWKAADKREQKNPACIDKKGNQKKPRCCQKIILALPKEATKEQHVQMCREYAETFRKQGRCGSFRIHYDKDHNPHAHFLLTVRQLDKNGEWETAKVRRVPELDKDGNKIQEQCRVLDEHGNYLKDIEGKFIMQPKFRTNSAGRRIAVYKYKKVDGYDWDSKSYLENNIRGAWEKIQNKYLELVGAEKCSFKTLTAQQVEQDIPLDERHRATIHEGHESKNAAKARIFNEEIRDYNELADIRKGERIEDDRLFAELTGEMERFSTATAGNVEGQRKGDSGQELDNQRTEYANLRLQANADRIFRQSEAAHGTGRSASSFDEEIRGMLATEERERAAAARKASSGRSRFKRTVEVDYERD